MEDEITHHSISSTFLEVMWDVGRVSGHCQNALRVMANVSYTPRVYFKIQSVLPRTHWRAAGIALTHRCSITELPSRLVISAILRRPEGWRLTAHKREAKCSG